MTGSIFSIIRDATFVDIYFIDPTSTLALHATGGDQTWCLGTALREQANIFALWGLYIDMAQVVHVVTIPVEIPYTVYPKKYAHSFVVLCFFVVMQSFLMNSHEVFIHIHQGCFAGTGAIVRLPQCQWSKPDGYGKISQCITTTKHSKAKTVCIFLGIYCMVCNCDVVFQ